ncbi:uncharacterized protein LOC127360307 [Dicentrarchus labrax]|uniref:uncharacterized protein LOC127360307 n=1 Tax=Dicentrarchus labrax TaxID=13489 RepID=UPI0021F5F01E|nr:uncharacterized protein LOC127360307 [Dicentrarchus labrax]
MYYKHYFLLLFHSRYRPVTDQWVEPDVTTVVINDGQSDVRGYLYEPLYISDVRGYLYEPLYISDVRGYLYEPLYISDVRGYLYEPLYISDVRGYLYEPLYISDVRGYLYEPLYISDVRGYLYEPLYISDVRGYLYEPLYISDVRGYLYEPLYISDVRGYLYEPLYSEQRLRLLQSRQRTCLSRTRSPDWLELGRTAGVCALAVRLRTHGRLTTISPNSLSAMGPAGREIGSRRGFTR